MRSPKYKLNIILLALKGSSTFECFEPGNAIETHNRIMFDFYPALPHLL